MDNYITLVGLQILSGTKVNSFHETAESIAFSTMREVDELLLSKILNRFKPERGTFRHLINLIQRKHFILCLKNSLQIKKIVL